VSRKNQANARKRAGRKLESVEPTIIEVAAMAQIAAAPPSPPTSGSYKGRCSECEDRDLVARKTLGMKAHGRYHFNTKLWVRR
jgi:hypothetical protein